MFIGKKGKGKRKLVGQQHIFGSFVAFAVDLVATQLTCFCTDAFASPGLLNLLYALFSPFIFGRWHILTDAARTLDEICKSLFYELIPTAVEKVAKDAIFPISQNHRLIHLYYLPPI